MVVGVQTRGVAPHPGCTALRGVYLAAKRHAKRTWYAVHEREEKKAKRHEPFIDTRSSHRSPTEAGHALLGTKRLENGPRRGIWAG